MPNYRIVLAAAVLMSVPAGAQGWGGSPSRGEGAGRAATPARQAAPAGWNGVVSKWGGSPVEPRVRARQTQSYVVPAQAVIPVVVPAPEAVPVTYAPDTVYAGQQGVPVDFQAAIPAGRTAAPSTMDVYRQQARFRNRQP